jgi:V8-like Glu-specific endopeptidase
VIRLTQTFGAHTGRVVELEKDVVRFGRLPDNEVPFDPHADLDASGRHAEIRREGAQWVLVDVGSRNGTLVRGRRVTRHVLASGDEVEFGLGGPRMRIELGAQRSSAATAQATPLGAGPSNRPPPIETAAATPVARAQAAPISAPGSVPGWGPTAPKESEPPSAMRPTPPPSPFLAPVSPPASYPGQPGMPPGSYPGQLASPPIGAPMGSASPYPVSPLIPPAPAVPGEKRYGQKTVGMMIQAALEQADQRRGVGKSTAQFEAMATAAASKSSRGLKIVVAVLTLLVLATAGGLIALFYFAQWKEQELRDENVDLQRQLADLGNVDEANETEARAERERIETRLTELNSELRAQQEDDGARIAERNDGAVYIILTRRSGTRQVVCSAFAVRADLLATNAHCVGAIERALENDQPIEVLPNRGRGAPLRVRQMWRHPMYRDDARIPSPDVGLIRVDRALSSFVTIANMEQLAALRPGSDVFVYGFPEVIAPTGSPVAAITTGVVGRMTAFDGTDAEQSRRHLIAHSALSDEGAAGSPVFDSEGRVVAINASNYRVRNRVSTPVPGLGTRSREVETETPYAWAVRSDLLLQLLAGLPQQ